MAERILIADDDPVQRRQERIRKWDRHAGRGPPASLAGSTLEMVREGLVDVHQQAAFAPIDMRKRPPAKDAMSDAGSAGAADASKN